jgi:sigma-B regulation protein RsbU (phosphoserine phosphatase)
MRAAAEIQQSILPPSWAPVGPAACVDLHAEMHPAREVGGDFYDYHLIDPSRLTFTIADVSGKGIPAALFMAVSRTVMRGIAGRHDLGAAMSEANRLLATHNTASMFVTLFYGVLDPATGVLRYCNAGHNPPYRLRAAGGRSRLEATGIAMGIEDKAGYGCGEIVMAAGDMLFLFTDGIPEAFDAAGNQFGATRLEAALDEARGCGPADLVRKVLGATAAFTAGAEQSDDITCLSLAFRGAPVEG